MDVVIDLYKSQEIALVLPLPAELALTLLQVRKGCQKSCNRCDIIWAVTTCPCRQCNNLSWSHILGWTGTFGCILPACCHAEAFNASWLHALPPTWSAPRCWYSMYNKPYPARQKTFMSISGSSIFVLLGNKSTAIFFRSRAVNVKTHINKCCTMRVSAWFQNQGSLIRVLVIGFDSSPLVYDVTLIRQLSQIFIYCTWSAFGVIWEVVLTSTMKLSGACRTLHGTTYEPFKALPSSTTGCLFRSLRTGCTVLVTTFSSTSACSLRIEDWENTLLSNKSTSADYAGTMHNRYSPWSSIGWEVLLHPWWGDLQPHLNTSSCMQDYCNYKNHCIDHEKLYEDFDCKSVWNEGRSNV